MLRLVIGRMARASEARTGEQWLECMRRDVLLREQLWLSGGRCIRGVGYLTRCPTPLVTEQLLARDRIIGGPFGDGARWSAGEPLDGVGDWGGCADVLFPGLKQHVRR